MAIEFLRQLRAAVFGPVGTAFSFDRAPHESGILGRELTKLTLHGVDGGALFGDLVRDGGDPTRDRLPLTDAGKLVEDITVIGIDGVTTDPRFPSEGCDGQPPVGRWRTIRTSGQTVKGGTQLLGRRLHASVMWICGRHLRHGLLLWRKDRKGCARTRRRESRQERGSARRVVHRL